MKSIKIDLPKNSRYVEIVPLADLHLGDPLCDLEKIKHTINSHPNAYFILNGDLINNATRNSVSDIYGETMSPMEELKLCADLLRPIKERILVITNGNHELRSHKGDGIDLMEILSRELGVEYSPTSALLFIKIGDTNHSAKHSQGHYTIFVNHGTGGGRSEGASVNKLTNMASIVDADIYIHSHTHVPAIIKNSFYRVNNNTRSTIKIDRLFVNTSAFLNYGGYGEQFEYKVTCTDTPYIILDSETRSMEARV